MSACILAIPYANFRSLASLRRSCFWVQELRILINNQGPSLAIIVNGRPYLVDCGPGLVRQAALVCQKGIEALATPNLDHLFVTHLHTDHTIGYPDLIFTPAVTGRVHALQVCGLCAVGISAMTNHLIKAYAQDREIRFHNARRPGGYENLESPRDQTGRGVRRECDGDGVLSQPWRLEKRFRLPLRDSRPHDRGVGRYDLLPQPHQARGGLRRADSRSVFRRGAEGEDGRRIGRRIIRATTRRATTSARIAAVLKPKLVLLYHDFRSVEPAGEILGEVRSRFDGAVEEDHGLRRCPERFSVPENLTAKNGGGGGN